MMNLDGTNFSILIVDDNRVNIQLLSYIFEQQDYKVFTAMSGEEAIKFLADKGDELAIDLILLDIIMPGLDGYQTCVVLKDDINTSHIPVIFVTGKAKPEELSKGFSVGAVDYITKPIQQDVVIARVKNQVSQIQQAKLENQLLEENEKMAKLGSMVSEITHEVASPLGNMRLSVDFMLNEVASLRSEFTEQTLDEETLIKYLDQLDESLRLCGSNATRATSLLNGFKHIAVDQCRQQIIEFNLLEYVNDILLTVKPKLKKTPHKVNLNIDNNISIISYLGALSQIIINLINNSLMHAFTDKQEGKITISAAVDEESLILHYRDTGIGMTKEQQSKAFTKFYTTKAGNGGSGLGMSICKTLVEDELGGEITLLSEEGCGIHLIMKISRQLEDRAI
ncbi:sensor histidine kinase [Shewanella hanedai]|nr:hybrid sensor histidine kinase/response regulator [Shewanella hanedai]